MSTIPKTGRTVIIWNDAECMGEMNTFRMEDLTERAAITHQLRALQPDGTSIPGYVTAKCHVTRTSSAVDLTYSRHENAPRVHCARYASSTSVASVTAALRSPLSGKNRTRAPSNRPPVAIWLSNQS